MKISKEKAFSIMESFLFMSSEPRAFSEFQTLFKEELTAKELKGLLEEFKNSYNSEDRGIQVEQTAGGWQMRTKVENKDYLLRIKPAPVFRLSRPSLEALSIIAFEQPCAKMEIDEIRGVESGHLLRTLMEKGLIALAGKSDLPGRASLYKTTKKFLEVFGFESLQDLPSREEVEELMDSGGRKDKEDLPSVSESFSAEGVKIPYEEDEQENKQIKDRLKSLPSSVEFLEAEKKQKKAAEQNPALEEETAPAEPDSPQAE